MKTLAQQFKKLGFTALPDVQFAKGNVTLPSGVVLPLQQVAEDTWHVVRSEYESSDARTVRCFKLDQGALDDGSDAFSQGVSLVYRQADVVLSDRVMSGPSLAAIQAACFTAPWTIMDLGDI